MSVDWLSAERCEEIGGGGALFVGRHCGRETRRQLVRGRVSALQELLDRRWHEWELGSLQMSAPLRGRKMWELLSALVSLTTVVSALGPI